MVESDFLTSMNSRACVLSFLCLAHHELLTATVLCDEETHEVSSRTLQSHLSKSPPKTLIASEPHEADDWRSVCVEDISLAINNIEFRA